MSIIDHILLFSLLFAVYAFWGKYNAHRSGVSFWAAALVPVLLYVFIIGSRYGWGNDYLWYKAQFKNIALIEDQIVFKWLNQFLNYIGINDVEVFMVYAFIFIVGAFVFTHSFGERSVYMYCFLVPATMTISTWTIRQGVGLAFIFPALVFLRRKKWLFMALAAFVAFHIHSSTIVTLAVIVGVFFIFKKPVSCWITIPLYLFFTFFFDVSKMGFLSDFLSKYVMTGNRFQSYIDNSDRWFGAEAVSDIYVQSTFALVMSSLFYVSLFYLGNRALKIRKDRQVLCMYHTVVFGVILLRASFLYEIWRRVAEAWVMFYFVPLGYIFYVYFRDFRYTDNAEATRLKNRFRAGIAVILAYLLMYWGRFIFLNPLSDFFWYH